MKVATEQDRWALLSMQTIEADPKAQLSELLDHIERGEDIFLTRQGKVVARIVPEPERSKQPDDIQGVIAAVEAFRQTTPKLSLDEILTARHEGHRH